MASPTTGFAVQSSDQTSSGHSAVSATAPAPCGPPLYEPGFAFRSLVANGQRRGMVPGGRCVALFCWFLSALAWCEACWQERPGSLEAQRTEGPGETTIPGLRCSCFAGKRERKKWPRSERLRHARGGRGNGQSGPEGPQLHQEGGGAPEPVDSRPGEGGDTVAGLCDRCTGRVLQRERENDMRKHSRVSTATSRRRRPCSPRPGGPCETRS